MNETRTVFQGLSEWQIDLWYGLITMSTAVFLWGVGLLVNKYRQGRSANWRVKPRHVADALWLVLSHRSIRRRDGLAGISHFLIFSGFCVLFIGTTVLGVQVDLTKPIFHFEFWHGEFYLGYKLCLDIAGGLLLAGLLGMGVRRGLVRPHRLDYARPDRAPSEYDRRAYVVGDWIFLAALLFLVLTGFLLEGLSLRESAFALGSWSPLGFGAGRTLGALGLGTSQARSAYRVVWWIHGTAALLFVSSIPFTKAVHMLIAPTNLAVSDVEDSRVLKAPEESNDNVGYSKITDLSWKELLSLDACTKCGKCHEACPANAGGYPLSPRDLVLDLRTFATDSMSVRGILDPARFRSKDSTLLGDPLRPETLWSCTQCMACVNICPVGIEHVPIINQFRRRLIDEGRMEQTLQSTLEVIHRTGNSFGQPARKRPVWTRDLGFAIKDVRYEPAEFLWFVGDYASFDTRSQRATRALARILHDAEIDFGILYDAERTSGCDVRRVGEEGLFESLAGKNIESIEACSFEKIFTSDPHSFHALKNEYPTFGASWTVLHHSELLSQLLGMGKVKISSRLSYRVTFHDPCMLGRYNSVYEAPRDVLQAVGIQIVEMPRNRANSFCCGAGGGRIWMKEIAKPGSRRPSEQRIDEAVGLGGLDYFVVACPKDVVMYEDAIKTSGHQREIELREISELVLEATAERG